MSSYLVATLGAAIFAAALIVDPTVAAAAGPQFPSPGSTRDGVCPEGFRPATPPLNPALGCLPDNIYMPPPLPDPFIPPGGCPSGWLPVTPPLNPVLICLPAEISLQPASSAPSNPPRGCPEGWRPATPPRNPLLICLPNTIVIPPPVPAGDCPDGWPGQRRRATPRWAACRIPSSFR